jgi:integrase
MSLAETLRARTGRRLGRPHFAFLRAVVEGVSTTDAAPRYLGTDGQGEARDAHHQVVDALRAIALRRGTDVWARLAEGVEIRRPRAPRPCLDVWAESAGLDPAEWGEADLLAMYHEAHPPGDDALEEAKVSAQQRRDRIALLRALEDRDSEAALPEHAVDGWFDEQTAQRLHDAGVETLGELQLRIARSQRWYTAVDAIGPTKADAIEDYVDQLQLPALPESAVAFAPALAIEDLAMRATLAEPLGLVPAPAPPVELSRTPPSVAQQVDVAAPSAVTVLPAVAVDQDHALVADGILPREMRRQLAAAGLDGAAGTNRRRPAGLAARDDMDAAAAWICARAGKPGDKASVAPPATAYRQQLRRLLLWCTGTRQVALSSMTSADCAAYMVFLSDIPDGWISPARAPAWSAAWRPFAGQLTASSREQAIRQVAGMFGWLVDNQYLQVNPWRALKLRQPDDPARRPRESHAFTPEAWAALLAYLDGPEMAPAGENLRARQRRAERERMRFVLGFNEAAGLRATEFVSARVEHLAFDGKSWTLHVHGKGSRNRLVMVAPQAARALKAYFRSRGFSAIADAPPQTPLLAQLLSPGPITYAGFYEAFKDFVREAVEASTLAPAERAVAAQASTHWMRHTAAVRLDERNAHAQVIKDHLGHESLETTMRYLKTQERRRRAQVDEAFS